MNKLIGVARNKHNQPLASSPCALCGLPRMVPRGKYGKETILCRPCAAKEWRRKYKEDNGHPIRKLLSTPSRDTLLTMYDTSGMSTKDIAKKYNCSGFTISKLMREYGIPKRSSSDAHKTQQYRSKFSNTILATTQQMIDFYVVDGLSLGYVAKKCGCSASGVRCRLIASGVQIRDKHDSLKLLIKLGIRQPHKFTLAQIERDRQAQIARYTNPEQRLKTGLATKLAHAKDPSIVVRAAISAKARFELNPALRIESSIRNKSLWDNPEKRAAAGLHAKRLWQNPATRTKMIDSHKRFWASNSPQFIELRKKMIAGLNLFPNKPETAVLNVLDSVYPGEWEYTGDGKEIIGGLNPDFMCRSGTNLIIEMFGDYWHTQTLKPYRVNEGRVDVYAQFGYRTLIIWEHEVKNTMVMQNKIVDFVDSCCKDAQLVGRTDL